MKRLPVQSKISVAAIGILFLLAACKHGRPVPSPTLTQVIPINTAIPQMQATLEGGGTASAQPGPPQTVTYYPTLTRSPTASPFPTRTRTPTPTHRPTNTHKPTFTPSLSTTVTETPVFPIGWQPAWQNESVTYIPTSLPEKPVAEFRLKPWSEQDAIDLVRLMDIYAYSQDQPALSESRYDYQAALPPVKLSIQEALHRFPDGAYADMLDWHLALTNAWMNNPASNSWLFNEIQTALNNAVTTPQDLDNFIMLHGFRIELLFPESWNSSCFSNIPDANQDTSKAIRSLSVSNLFGDKSEGQIFWLTTDGFHGEDGVYFALRRDDHGKYIIYPVLSAWDFALGDDHIICVSDHTKDGIPEIIIPVGRLSGLSCNGYLHVYQWRNDHFEDLTRGAIRSCESSWDYISQNGDSYDVIEAGVLTGETNLYAWYGDWYEQVDSWYVDYSLVEIIEKDITHGDYYSATQFIEQKIRSWSASDTNERGASYPDYLRFQLGMVYALQSKVGDAKKEFQQLIDDPTNPTVTAIPQAAQAFLAQYNDDTDVYRACQSALESMEKTIASYRGENGQLDREVVKEVWGYVEENDRSVPICELDEAFPLLVRTLGISLIADPLTALRQAGVTIPYSAKADVNGDGLEDWIEVVIKPKSGDEAEVASWVLLNTGQSLTPLPVLPYFKQYDAPDKASALADFRIDTVMNAINQAPLTFLQTGDYLYTFQIGQKGDHYQIIKLFQDKQLKNYSILQDSNPLTFRIWYTVDQYTPEWAQYRWDPVSNKFQSVEEQLSAPQRSYYGPTDSAILAEEMLLNWKPAEAISLLKNVFALPAGENEGGCFAYDPTWYCMDRPRLHYLLGLAYELTGDQADAVQTYWQLWHDYPGSPYALMARAKLEPAP